MFLPKQVKFVTSDSKEELFCKYPEDKATKSNHCKSGRCSTYNEYSTCRIQRPLNSIKKNSYAINLPSTPPPITTSKYVTQYTNPSEEEVIKFKHKKHKFVSEKEIEHEHKRTARTSSKRRKSKSEKSRKPLSPIKSEREVSSTSAYQNYETEKNMKREMRKNENTNYCISSLEDEKIDGYHETFFKQSFLYNLESPVHSLHTNKKKTTKEMNKVNETKEKNIKEKNYITEDINFHTLLKKNRDHSATKYKKKSHLKNSKNKEYYKKDLCVTPGYNKYDVFFATSGYNVNEIKLKPSKKGVHVAGKKKVCTGVTATPEDITKCAEVAKLYELNNTKYENRNFDKCEKTSNFSKSKKRNSDGVSPLKMKYENIIDNNIDFNERKIAFEYLDDTKNISNMYLETELDYSKEIYNKYNNSIEDNYYKKRLNFHNVSDNDFTGMNEYRNRKFSHKDVPDTYRKNINPAFGFFRKKMIPLNPIGISPRHWTLDKAVNRFKQYNYTGNLTSDSDRDCPRLVATKRVNRWEEKARQILLETELLIANNFKNDDLLALIESNKSFKLSYDSSTNNATELSSKTDAYKPMDIEHKLPIDLSYIDQKYMCYDAQCDQPEEELPEKYIHIQRPSEKNEKHEIIHRTSKSGSEIQETAEKQHPDEKFKPSKNGISKEPMSSLKLTPKKHASTQEQNAVNTPVNANTGTDPVKQHSDEEFKPSKNEIGKESMGSLKLIPKKHVSIQVQKVVNTSINDSTGTDTEKQHPGREFKPSKNEIKQKPGSLKLTHTKHISIQDHRAVNTSINARMGTDTEQEEEKRGYIRNFGKLVAKLLSAKNKHKGEG